MHRNTWFSTWFFKISGTIPHMKRSEKLFSRTLQFALQGSATVIICRLSVRRLWRGSIVCDESVQASFTRFSLKRHEIVIRSQLIANTKSYVGFRGWDSNKSRWLWTTLNVNSLFCLRCYVYCHQTAEESRDFSQKAVQYLSFLLVSLTMKFLGICSNGRVNAGRGDYKLRIATWLRVTRLYLANCAR